MLIELTGNIRVSKQLLQLQSGESVGQLTTSDLDSKGDGFQLIPWDLSFPLSLNSSCLKFTGLSELKQKSIPLGRGAGGKQSVTLNLEVTIQHGIGDKSINGMPLGSANHRLDDFIGVLGELVMDEGLGGKQSGLTSI